MSQIYLNAVREQINEVSVQPTKEVSRDKYTHFFNKKPVYKKLGLQRPKN